MAGDVNSNAAKELDSLIDKPTHFFNGGFSCIDLIFCNKPEIVSRTDHSLFQICHHNLIFAKISDNVFPQIIVEKFGTTKMPVLKEYKNPDPFLINEKVGLLNSQQYSE